MGTSSLLKIGSRSFFPSRSKIAFNQRRPLHALLSSSTIAPSVEKFRKDYKSLPWSLDSVRLDFMLRDTTIVNAKLFIDFPQCDREDLVLDCEDVDVKSIKIDGSEIDQYSLNAGKLTIPAQFLPSEDKFELESTSELEPKTNLQLSGLYSSSGTFCTQCEAEGFRRIVPFPDRPDVMTKYRVRLEADKTKYPILLSNGNKIQCGNKGDTHFAIWEDPYKKPSYLFALVAGDLASISDSFTTCSNRKVHLEIFTEHGNEDQLDHAMKSLKRAMKWDEDRFGLEYDLDIYNIVAVSDFNMGAMENKGLNIFNTALTLAKQSTATDGDYERIESVIGHEYFHNWSGNRVTCRDFFQLTLKEGLTVYRDQEFSKDMGDPAVCRINEVRSLRSRQFPEDSGPLAHPIRPESYFAMDNFYTTTVYEKGAEVIRMYETLLGRGGFRKGLDLYFNKYDGQAVTCDDFRQALSDANKVDLTQFERWYTQPGTPVVKVTDRSYDPEKGIFSFTLSQTCRDAVDGTKAQPFHIPFLVGMLDGETGSQILDSTLLELTQPSQTFSLQLPKGLSSVVPSFLRNFSAPVKLQIEPPLNTEDLSFLMQHDTDAYNRWDAAQSLVMRTLFDSYVGGDQSLVEVEKAMKAVLLLSIEKKDWRFLASVLLALPSLNEFCQALPLPVDPVLATQSRRKVKHRLAQALRSELLLCLKATDAGSQTDFSIIPEEQGRRALHNLCLDYLAPLEGGSSLALEHYKAATCMTDKLGALTAITPLNTEDSEFALNDFKTHAVDALVVDKWFTVQASVCSVARIRDLLAHEEFSWSNPNRIRSVLSAFSSSNLEHFHSESGEGYELVGNAVLKLDTTNHQVSARLAQCFSSWHRYDETRQTLMKAQLTRFVSKEGVSKELFEVASKCLNN